MRRTLTLLTLCAALEALAPTSGAQSGLDIDHLLAAPFPTELTAAPAGNRFAWVASASFRFCQSGMARLRAAQKSGPWWPSRR